MSQLPKPTVDLGPGAGMHGPPERDVAGPDVFPKSQPAAARPAVHTHAVAPPAAQINQGRHVTFPAIHDVLMRHGHGVLAEHPRVGTDIPPRAGEPNEVLVPAARAGLNPQVMRRYNTFNDRGEQNPIYEALHQEALRLWPEHLKQNPELNTQEHFNRLAATVAAEHFPRHAMTVDVLNRFRNGIDPMAPGQPREGARDAIGDYALGGFPALERHDELQRAEERAIETTVKRSNIARAQHENARTIFPAVAHILDEAAKQPTNADYAKYMGYAGEYLQEHGKWKEGEELLARAYKIAPELMKGGSQHFRREHPMLFARGEYDTVDESLWAECCRVVPKSKPFRVPFVLGKIDGNDVCAADFDVYKIKYDMDTVEGANDLETDWPRKEFGPNYLLVDINLALHEWAWVLYHEAHERQLMADGMSYDTAHKHANACEKQLRERGTERAAVPERYARNEQAVAFFSRHFFASSDVPMQLNSGGIGPVRSSPATSDVQLRSNSVLDAAMASSRAKYAGNLQAERMFKRHDDSRAHAQAARKVAHGVRRDVAKQLQAKAQSQPRTDKLLPEVSPITAKRMEAPAHGPLPELPSNEELLKGTWQRRNDLSDSPGQKVGVNPSFNVIMPGGEKMFVKHPYEKNSIDVEIAANKIQRLLGLNVPEVKGYNHPNFGAGLVSPYLVGGKQLADTTALERSNAIAAASPHEYSNHVLTNWLMDAADRHGGNYMLHEGHVVPIDYGYTFDEGALVSRDVLMRYGFVSPNTPLDKETIKKILASQVEVRKIVSEEVADKGLSPDGKIKLENLDENFNRLAELFQKPEPKISDL